MNPIINILTRTSNRPNGFSVNRESITNQTYKNINHIVCYDTDETKEYLDNYEGITKVAIDREMLISNDTSLNPNTGKYSPHNLYFNEMFKEVKSGWIIMLDDDNTFSNNNVVQNLVDMIESDDCMFIWQILFPKTHGSLVIPMGIFTVPTLGNIDTGCVMYHSKYKDISKWDGWKCGDFRYIDSLFTTIPKNKFLSVINIDIGQIGNGNRTDIIKTNN